LGNCGTRVVSVIFSPIIPKWQESIARTNNFILYDVFTLKTDLNKHSRIELMP
jgi:hypothetical protein